MSQTPDSHVAAAFRGWVETRLGWVPPVNDRRLLLASRTLRAAKTMGRQP